MVDSENFDTQPEGFVWPFKSNEPDKSFFEKTMSREEWQRLEEHALAVREEVLDSKTGPTHNED